MEKNPHNKNLLVELLVEELPPKALNKLGEAFSSVLFESLKAQGLTLENAEVTAFATPRRLAAHVKYVKDKAEDKQVSQKLMPASVGLDANGKATPALLKKLQSLGADESVVGQLKNDNNTLFLDAMQTGVGLPEGLQKALDEALAKLPIPKVMTYQLHENTDNPGWDSVHFVRPAHGLVAMHGSSVLQISALGLQSGNTTIGHRFESTVDKITLNHADSYENQLLDEGCVIASFAARKADIVRQLKSFSEAKNLKAIDDDALLDEVTALVEKPNVLLGQFEAVYLEVPQECLILTMKANQKYFPLMDNNNKLTNQFLIVSNISPKDPSAVIGGNERVVRPRLADAKFFFDQDRKKTLESRIAGLDKVVYHNKLGSQGERNKRVVAIAGEIAKQLGDANLVAKVALAARLSKADLVTDMVGEFPELQGIMGRYYAQHEGLDDDVAFAIEDHYKPRFAGDELPRNMVGICLAIADKLETLVGMFCVGNVPTGDKDPFALRRQALGIFHIIRSSSIEVPFDKLVELTLDKFKEFSFDSPNVMKAVCTFTMERIKNYYEAGTANTGSFSTNEVESVLSLNPEDLSSIQNRLVAVRLFSMLPEAPSLASANKRVTNILQKSGVMTFGSVNPQLLKDEAEKELNKHLIQIKFDADKYYEQNNYTASLKRLADLESPLDAFFTNVMVNSDDDALKSNRLNLLAILHQTMNRVADLSKLAS